MHHGIGLDDIRKALRIAGLEGFTGGLTELGGGEVNDTFLLAMEDGPPIVLRVAKHTDQQSLFRESNALQTLDIPRIPKLLFFDPDSRLQDRSWILESYVEGVRVKRLSLQQFESLGRLLANVHKIVADKPGVYLWQEFLVSNRRFGDEQYYLDHPDPELRRLIRSAHTQFGELQPTFDTVRPTLVHSDATPSNILVVGDEVGLIDWEFSKFKDPMSDFATIYYDDMEYNLGKWRIHISPDEKSALFNGYEAGGGTVDNDRINVMMRHDKLGAACFLYWRLHESERPVTESQRKQYAIDLQNLITSLSATAR